MISIFISDDHVMFREGMRRLLEVEDDFSIIGEAGTGRETLEKCRELSPDVLLLDIDMPEMDGIDVTKRIQDEGMKIKIIILTMHMNEEYAVRLIKSGASGFVPKYVSGTILPSAIRLVISGKTYIPEEMKETVLSRLLDSQKNETNRLSDRELQVFKSLAEGKTIHEIADALCISPRTVETHKSRIMAKLDLKNIAELVRVAIRMGLVDNF